MSAQRSCERCGKDLPESGTARVCPACIAQLGQAPWLDETGAGKKVEADTMTAVEIEATAMKPHPTTRIRYFGDYELLEEIARGGMGVVFKARQVSLNRTVALKMIVAGHLASLEAVRRFQTEAEAAARLDHPHIVPIYEIGEHEGHHYFSMRFLDGGTLTQALDRAKFSPRRAAELLITVARAVHCAHQHGILHRDIKPGNILLDGRGEPHVADFGLAKVMEAENGLAQTKSLIGTPSYMAPEQISGSNNSLSTAADVYGLGAVLYELLTGRAPFRGSTPTETMRRVVEAEPERPRLINPVVDRDIETICLKCLEKDPERRYGSAEALAEDLGRWLRREPIQARPSTAWERTVKWLRRKPALAGLATVTCIAAMALTGFFISVPAYHKAEQARIDEQKQRYQTEQALQLAERARAAETIQKVRAERESARAAISLYLANIAEARLARQTHNMDRAIQLLEQCAENLRNWEWYYLRKLCRSELGVGRGHNANILALSFVGDEGEIASIDSNGVLGRWNFYRDAPALVVTNGPKGVMQAAFSKDGSRMAVYTRPDWRVHVWNVLEGKQELDVEPGHLSCLTISPNGQGIAIGSGSRHSKVEVWNVTTRQLVLSRTSQFEDITCMAFSPDGQNLVVGGGAWRHTGEIEIWDLNSQRTMKLSGPTNTVLSLVCSPDGELVAAAGLDQTIRVWSATSGQLLHALAHDDLEGSAGIAGDYSSFRRSSEDYVRAVRAMVFSPDGKRLASCGDDGTVKIWELATATQIIAYAGRSKRIQAIAFSPDGNLVASEGANHVMMVRNLAPDSETVVIQGYSEGLAFSRDGKRLTSGGQVWSALDGELLAGAETNTQMGKPAFSPDGVRMANGKGIFDALTGEMIRAMGWTKTVQGLTYSRELDAYTATNPVVQPVDIYGVSFSPDGRMLATGRGRPPGDLKLWDAISGREVRTLTGHTNAVWDVAFSPDGRYVASASGESQADLHSLIIPGEARLWDVETGEALQIHFTKHCLYSVCFSGDARRLAASGGFYHEMVETTNRGTIKVWDVETGQNVFSATNLSSCVYSVALSTDGKRVVAAVGHWGEKGPFDVRLWDVDSGREIMTLGQHAGQVHAVAFSPDGQRIASASAYSDPPLIQIWSIE